VRPVLAAGNWLPAPAGDGEPWWWSTGGHTEAAGSEDSVEWTIASLRNEVQQLRQSLMTKEATNSVRARGRAGAADPQNTAATNTSWWDLAAEENASTSVAKTAQRVCSEEEKAAMSPKWLQSDGSRFEQMCSVYSPPPEYQAMGDMPPPDMWKPEEGTPDCCDPGQSCEVAGFRILENYLTLYSLCVSTANWTAT